MANINSERQAVGFYDLPLLQTKTYTNFVANNNSYLDIIIVGIGGSSLGANAIYEFIRYSKPLAKKLHILDTTDPIYLQYKLSKIDLKKALFIIISKSGTTIETVAILKYLTKLVPINNKQYVVITQKKSKLEAFAKYHNLTSFMIPHNVGGRFSVLSVVGLLPLALVGIDINAVLLGAKKIRELFFSGDYYYNLLLKKASFYAKYVDTYHTNCIFSYSSSFRGFNSWYIQLWAESLGKKQIHHKKHIGLTPVALIGPTDQHSFLQLLVEGKKDKSITVIKIKNFNNDMKIPNQTLKHIENMDMINNLTFSKLINMQADSIIDSLCQLKNAPLDVIEIDQIDERSIGELIYYYELLTVIVAQMLDINAYNQLGVEMGKKILKRKLNF